jgi:Ca-activated chloride channel homolog
MLGLLGLTVVGGQPAQAQSAPAFPVEAKSSPISISADLVDLPISVTDRNGDFVDGLGKENFRVFENGRQESISMFGRQDLPVAIGLVVDHSASMGPKLAEVNAAAESFARSSNPDDRLFVVNFNELVALTLPAPMPFTGDAGLLHTALSGAGARGQTALYDAVIEAIQHLNRSSLKRHALVVVTDGGDNVSRHTRKEMLDAARMSDVQIYSIGIFDGDDADASPGVLRKLATVSGGVAYFPKSAGEVTDIAGKIAVNLRKQYTLGFTPEARKEGWQNLRVVASGRDKLNVRSRTGYLFSRRQPAAPPDRAPGENQ